MRDILVSMFETSRHAMHYIHVYGVMTVIMAVVMVYCFFMAMNGVGFME